MIPKVNIINPFTKLDFLTWLLTHTQFIKPNKNRTQNWKIDFDKLLNKYNVLNSSVGTPKKRPFTNYVEISVSRRSKNTWKNPPELSIQNLINEMIRFIKETWRRLATYGRETKINVDYGIISFENHVAYLTSACAAVFCKIFHHNLDVKCQASSSFTQELCERNLILHTLFQFSAF